MDVCRVLARYRCRLLCHLVFATVAMAATACGSGSTSFVGPTGAKCEVSATNNTPELPAAGGTGTITVNTSRDCLWSASAGLSLAKMDSALVEAPRLRFGADEAIAPACLGCG
jgi:hypothetical protein